MSRPPQVKATHKAIHTYYETYYETLKQYHTGDFRYES